FLHTPLWPAGHLPHKGGDRMLRGFRQLSTLKKGAAPKPPISPLAEEMSGRTEGGAVPPAFRG
ncbi:MAG: lytic murein transglycosylase, partial [Mesorhizobium sp.]